MQTGESCVCVVATWLDRAHHLFSNKAVADGAVLSYIDPLVSSRTSRYTYGIKCRRRYSPSLADHQERGHTQLVSPSGAIVLPNAFQSILMKVCAWLLTRVDAPLRFSIGSPSFGAARI
jgi:hypothetical protein